MPETAERAARIGLDVRYLSHGLVGGVHTYIRNLTAALCRLPDERQWFLYADTKAPFELVELPATVRVRTIPWRNGASSMVNDLRLGRAMARDGVSIAHAPANYGFTPATVPLVITLHDAINLLSLKKILQDDAKNPRHLALMTYLHLVTVAALRRQPFIITVSHYSRQEILRHSALPPERVHVVHSAHDSNFRVIDAATTRELRERLRLRPRVLLADAIKNPDCVLRAYRALPAATRAATSLVFFARRPPAQAVQDAAAAGECLLLHRPAFADLITLYNVADFFVFPSWYEGFGLPALEALACGTPVIASSRGSLPEVVGGGGIIVDAEDHQAIASAIEAHFAHPAALTALREAALAQAGRFSWEQTARQTLEVYDEAFRHAKHPATAPRPTGALSKRAW